jgi:hypothetical protein
MIHVVVTKCLIGFLSFYKGVGVGVGVSQIEELESEVFCTDSTALHLRHCDQLFSLYRHYTMFLLLLGHVVTFHLKAYYTSTSILFFSNLSVTHNAVSQIQPVEMFSKFLAYKW